MAWTWAPRAPPRLPKMMRITRGSRFLTTWFGNAQTRQHLDAAAWLPAFQEVHNRMAARSSVRRARTGCSNPGLLSTGSLHGGNAIADAFQHGIQRSPVVDLAPQDDGIDATD